MENELQKPFFKNLNLLIFEDLTLQGLSFFGTNVELP